MLSSIESRQINTNNPPKFTQDHPRPKAMCFWYILELHFFAHDIFHHGIPLWGCGRRSADHRLRGCPAAERAQFDHWAPRLGDLFGAMPGRRGSGYSWPQLAPGQWWSVSQDWPKFGLIWTKGAQRSWHWPMVSVDVLRSLDMKIRTEDMRSAWLVSAVRPRRAFLLAMSSSRAALVVWDGDINNWILSSFLSHLAQERSQQQMVWSLGRTGPEQAWSFSSSNSFWSLRHFYDLFWGLILQPPVLICLWLTLESVEFPAEVGSWGDGENPCRPCDNKEGFAVYSADAWPNSSCLYAPGLHGPSSALGVYNDPANMAWIVFRVLVKGVDGSQNGLKMVSLHDTRAPFSFRNTLGATERNVISACRMWRSTPSASTT